MRIKVKSSDVVRVEQFAQELDSWDFFADEVQRGLHGQYQELLATDPTSLSRERTRGHFTASALILDPKRAQVMLVLHPRVKRWLQMGGHIESTDESFREAAAREGSEESGYHSIEVLQIPARLDRHDVPCKSPGGEVITSVHWDVQFLALVDSRELREITEDAATKWWDIRDPIPEIDHSVELLIGAARRFLRQ